jgi:two-component system chemotaxis response regulator CheY
VERPYQGRREWVLLSKVLIVDDAYSMRNLIKKALREAGHEVVGEAKNGAEGLKMFKELKPDLVTMDIKMPDISGIDVTRQILSEYPNAKIIAVTGNNDENIKKEILQAGAKDYLRKPFQPAFLLTKIEGMLQEEPETVVLEETASLIGVEPIPKEVKQEEEAVDDFFEDVEVELLDKPDETKLKVLVIENQEDAIEFPKEYPAEEEAELHSLKSDSFIDLDEKEEIDLSVELDEPDESSIVVAPSTKPSLPSKEQVTPFEEEIELSSDEERTLSSPPISHVEEDKPLIEPSSPPSHPTPRLKSQDINSPISIRPPKGKLSESNDHDEREVQEEFEDFIIDASSEEITMTPQKKKGVFGFMKKIFKP